MLRYAHEYVCQPDLPQRSQALPCGACAFRIGSILVTSLFSPLACAKFLKYSSFIENPEGRTQGLV